MSNRTYPRSLLPRLVAVSVSGVLIGSASSVFAVDPEQQLHSTEATAASDDNSFGTFAEVDENQDQALDWSEIHSYYEDELDRVDWHETTVYSWFDTDADGQINPREYRVLLTNLANNPTARQEMLGDLATEGPDADNQTAPEATGPQGQREDIVLGGDSQGQETQDITLGADQPQAETQNIVLENDPATLSEPSEATADTSSQQNSNNARNAQAQGGNNWTSAGTQVGNESWTATSAPGNQQQQPVGTDGEALTPVMELGVDDIKEKPVQNLNGTEVGQVSDVVLRDDGSEAGLVVSLASSGEAQNKEVFVSLDQLGAAEDYLVWQTPLSAEQLNELPEYNDSIFVSIQ